MINKDRWRNHQLMLAHNQATGGVGMTLLEDTHLGYRVGRIVNANMADYLAPVNADVPQPCAMFLPAQDTIADPVGGGPRRASDGRIGRRRFRRDLQRNR